MGFCENCYRRIDSDEVWKNPPIYRCPECGKITKGEIDKCPECGFDFEKRKDVDKK